MRNIGSTNIITDRLGSLDQHFEYFAFGKDQYNDVACSFIVSNRYADQILVGDAGLYDYNIYHVLRGATTVRSWYASSEMC
jgi:hypothetical protein